MNRAEGGAEIESLPGTYALVLRCASEAVVRIGRLGELRLQRGFYVYVGSALGAGGVRARVDHHARMARHPHWHIDYLRPHALLEGVWYACEPKRREHDWAGAVARAGGARIPLRGFGVSDCDCESHLFFVAKRRLLRGVERRLGAVSQLLQRRFR